MAKHVAPGGHFSFKLYSKDHHWPPLGYRANNCVQGLLGRTTFFFPPKQAILSGFSALDWVITLSQIGLSPPPQQGFEPANPPDSSTGPRKNHLTDNRQTFSVCSTALSCKVLQENRFRTHAQLPLVRQLGKKCVQNMQGDQAMKQVQPLPRTETAEPPYATSSAALCPVKGCQFNL